MGLQSVWVLYTTHRYSWSVSDVGISLAIVGLLSAVVQGGLVRPVVARFGEARTLVGALVVATVSMILFGLATEGWMMYTVTAFYCLGLGLSGPAMQGLMSRAVPADEQGLLQGALASVSTGATIVGPLLAASLFGYFVGPTAPIVLPGAPFFLGGVLFLVSLAVALRIAGTAASSAPEPRLRTNAALP
jgi:DHA1 family tetracycline resistance protein-like MFS transporter